MMQNMRMRFSVLMSVHGTDNPNYLDEAINSVVHQSVRPDEVVLVKDGSLGEDLERVVNKWATRLAGTLRVVPLESSVGLGEALRIGTANCQYEIVARMDADDVSLPNRFESQIGFLQTNPDIDVVGSWVGEFDENPEVVIAVRATPKQSQDIRRYARFRNPVNHPTVVFRKEIVLRAGGYRSFDRFEDYDLWARLLMQGGRIANIGEVLVRQRVGRGFYTRRGGLAYVRRELALQISFLRMGFIDWKVFIANVAVRACVRCISSEVRARIYRKFLREPVYKA